MILLTYAATGYNPMVEKYLLPSALAFEVVRIKHQYPVSNWDTESFNVMCRHKITAIVEMINKLDDGEVFVYCDGDIELFGLTPEIILSDLGAYNICAHLDDSLKTIFCAGFLIFKCNSTTRKFCSDWLQLAIEHHADDQSWFNFLISNNPIVYSLPVEKYWNIGQVGLWYGGDSCCLENIKRLVPKTIQMFHANFTVGIDRKLELLETVRNARRDKLDTTING
jgi:hypothetical protein